MNIVKNELWYQKWALILMGWREEAGDYLFNPVTATKLYLSYRMVEKQSATEKDQWELACIILAEGRGDVPDPMKSWDDFMRLVDAVEAMYRASERGKTGYGYTLNLFHDSGNASGSCGVIYFDRDTRRVKWESHWFEYQGRVEGEIKYKFHPLTVGDLTKALIEVVLTRVLKHEWAILPHTGEASALKGGRNAD